jgi:two-component sensor histidine kinase
VNGLTDSSIVSASVSRPGKLSALSRLVPLTLIAGIAIAALAAWLFHIRMPRPNGSTLEPMTAICLLGLVAALIAFDRHHSRAAAWIGWIITAIGAITLVQNLAGHDLTIDTMLLRLLGTGELGPNDTRFRMDALNAIMLMLSGTAVARLGANREPWLVGTLAVAVAILSVSELLMVISDLADPPSFSPMGMASTVAFFFMGGELLRRQPLDLVGLMRRLGLQLGIGGWLITLALAAALPILLFAAMATQQLAAAERQSKLQELVQRTEGAALAVERLLRALRDQAVTLANTPLLISNNLAEFHEFAHRTLNASDPRRSISLADTNGQLLVTTRVPFGTPLPTTVNPKGFAESIASRAPRVSDLFVGAVTGRPVFGVWTPVIRDGEVAGALMLATTSEELDEVLREERVPPDWIATVTDGQGIIVARTRDAEKWIGKQASARLIASRAQSSRGAYSGQTIDGILVSSYFINLPNSHWSVAIGVPEAALNAPAWASLRLLLASGLISLAVAVGAAFLIGRNMQGQVYDVVRAAVALGQGGTITTSPSNIPELEQVATAMAAASVQIDDRESRLRRNMARQELLLEISYSLNQPDLDEAALGRIICENLAPEFHLDVCLNYRFESGKFTLAFASGTGAERQKSAENLAADEAFCGLVVETGRPITADAVRIASDPSASMIRAMGLTAYSCHPLIKEGLVVGTISFGSAKQAEFSAEEVAFFQQVATHLAHAWERLASERHAHLMSAEVNHRAKNLLAVVQAIAQITSRQTEPRLFAEEFGRRVRSLAASHDLVVKSQWQGVDLYELIQSQLAYFAGLIGTRIVCKGPSVQLTPSAAQAIGMALHELATNAGKYGALSNMTGHVVIGWQVSYDDKNFKIAWSESGGPPVTEPARRGFGHTVIVEMTTRALGGEASLRFPSDGLQWEVTAPLERVSASGVTAS